MDDKRLKTTSQQKDGAALGRIIDLYPERANLFALRIDTIPEELYKTERKERGK